jgi:isopenicillin N synthase-like dioxygenase
MSLDRDTLPPHAQLRESEIPIVDIGPLLAGASGALERAADEFHAACTGIGFMVLVNHGIDGDIVERAFEASRRFHALPMDEKMKVRMNRHQCGYMPPNVSVHRDTFENRESALRPQPSEAFKFTFDLAPDDPDHGKGRRFRGHNKWPDEALVPGLHDAFMDFHLTFEALGQKLLPPIAASLGLDPDYFAPFFARPSSMTRIAHYPATGVPDEIVTLPGHRDLSFLTLIPPATRVGLEVFTPDGVWVDQPVVPEGVLFNTGSTLSHWTNDVYAPTLHRVRTDPHEDRHSNIYFLYPDVDARMECVPTCVGTDRPAAYEPVTFGAFHADYAARNFAYAEDWD